MQLAGDIAGIVTAAVAAAALFFAWYQIRENRSAERRRMAYAYTARYNDVDLIPFLAEGRDFWVKTRSLSDSKAQDEWLALTRKEQYEVLVLPNFMEELAGMYNNGLLDKKIVGLYFGAFFDDFWLETAWFREWFRRKNDAYFCEWEKMLGDMSDRGVI